MLGPDEAGGERQVGPGDAAERAPQHHGGNTEELDVDAGDIGGRGVLADGAQPEPRVRAVEAPPHRDGERRGGVDQDVLLEDDRSDPRDVAERAQIEVAEARHLLEHVGPADDPGQPVAEGDDDEPGQHLVGAEDHDGDAEDEADQGTRQHGDGHASTGKPGVEAHDRAHHRAHQHHALAAEIEDAGALVDDQAECGEQVGRGEARRGGEPVLDEVGRHQACSRTPQLRR